MNHLLSIVTGTRNRPDDFTRLVHSICLNTPMPWELFVSDAGDQPLEKSGLPWNVFVIPERPRLGCAKGYNRAFRAATGKYVLWLNDDVEVLPGYAEAAVDFMETHPNIGLGALYYREGAKDFHVNSYYNMLYANFGIVRRVVGDAVGWFDELIPMYGCDNALTFRVLLAGYGVDAIPNSRVIHHAVDDAARRENNDDAARMRDAERLRDKYGSLLARMQQSYIETFSGKNIAANDQTPGWMWP